MKADFWHERWQSDQLGFHQSEVNPLLVEHWPALGVAQGTPVFVPLCGKSLDMRWLRDQGHPVLGVELSPIAVRDFFAEAGIDREVERVGTLERSSGSGYELLCGDFFDLTEEDLSDVGAVFDRASLIALPPELRSRYAAHLARVMAPDVVILLIIIDYDQSLMSGPPHSVPVSEVESLFGGDFEIETLATTGPQAPTPRFQERGLDSWCETVLRLERRSGA